MLSRAIAVRFCQTVWWLAAGDQAGIERLVQSVTRCPLSLSRLVKVSDSGQVVCKAEPSATVGAEEASPGRSRQSWAMLIKRVYESDTMSCPECGGQMAVVALIEPPQEDVIEKVAVYSVGSMK